MSGSTFYWLIFLFAAVFNAMNSIIFSFQEEEFLPGLNLYESKEKCIYAEKKDCTFI